MTKRLISTCNSQETSLLGGNRMVVSAFLLSLMLTVVGCQEKGEKAPVSTPTVTLEELSGSVWVSTVFDNCVDSLTFGEGNKGLYYSCEQELHYDIEYALKGSDVQVSVFDYESQSSATAALIISNKWLLQKRAEHLHFMQIERRAGDLGFKQVDEKFYKDSYFTKVGQ